MVIIFVKLVYAIMYLDFLSYCSYVFVISGNKSTCEDLKINTHITIRIYIPHLSIKNTKYKG